MKRSNVSNVVIEITRQCNMLCDHCLRGDAENVNINIAYVEKLFKQVEQISTLTITGGEPSLHPEIINQIVELAKEYNVGVSAFYMVTNAKRVTNEFLMSVMNLYALCDDMEEGGGLAISNDDYHDELIRENVKKLEVFRFTHNKSRYGERYDGNLINEGRASFNYPDCRELEPCKYEIWDNNISESDIYLNCKGDILSACDLSYESQDEKKEFFICNVTDKNFNLLKAVEEYNKAFELECV